MITLIASLDFKNPSVNLTNFSTGIPFPNAISKGLSNVFNTQKKAQNPFILGSNKLGKGANLISQVDYYISGLSYLSDIDGNFPDTTQLTIHSPETIYNITICFDIIGGYHPKSVTVGDKTFVDDDAIFTIPIENGATDIVIEISNWNAPNRPLVIQGVYVSAKLDLDFTNTTSISNTISDRAEITRPSYGIISNTGDCEFIDSNGEIKDLIELGIIKSGEKLSIYLKNSLNNNTDLIGIKYAYNWDYDSDIKSVRLELKDALEQWQSIAFEGFYFDTKYGIETNQKRASEIYEMLKSATPSNFEFADLDRETSDVLYRTMIYYPQLTANSLWNAWEKFCNLCLLHIFIEKNGKVKCVYNGGN